MSRRSSKPRSIDVLFLFAISLVAVFTFITSHETTIFRVLLIACLALIIPVVWYLLLRGNTHFQGFSGFFRHSLDPFKQATLNQIDIMTGPEFEKFAGRLFETQGYKVNYTKVTDDDGADLILTKNKIRTAVQAKRTKAVLGKKPIQEVIGSLMPYKCAKGIVITNSTFTKPAQRFAQTNYIKLIDRESITKMLETLQK